MKERSTKTQPTPEQNIDSIVTITSAKINIVGRADKDFQQAKDHSLQSNAITFFKVGMNVEVAASLRCDQAGRDLVGAASSPDEVQSIRPPADKPPEAKLEKRKVKTQGLDRLVMTNKKVDRRIAKIITVESQRD
jgi:hypothetical protein